MEIPQWLFFSFWAMISLTFLLLGFNALDRTNLSSSVSPAIMFVFKHALAISVCHSSHYALVFRPGLDIDKTKHRYAVVNALIPLIFLGTSEVMGMWYMLYCSLFTFFVIIKKRRASTVPENRIGLEIDFVVKLAMYCVNEEETKFFPTLVLMISVYTSAIWNAVFNDEILLAAAKEKENVMKWKPGESTLEYSVGIFCAIFFEKENSSFLKKFLYKRRELIGFTIGMVGTIFFQNYFQLTSFDHIVAFLYLVVAWLGNLAMLRASSDCGVFNFLLGNVIVGCTVSQFGLRGVTWMAFGASVLLFSLRLKLHSFYQAHIEAEETIVVI